MKTFAFSFIFKTIKESREFVWIVINIEFSFLSEKSTLSLI